MDRRAFFGAFLAAPLAVAAALKAKPEPEVEIEYWENPNVGHSPFAYADRGELVPVEGGAATYDPSGTHWLSQRMDRDVFVGEDFARLQAKLDRTGYESMLKRWEGDTYCTPESPPSLP